MKTVCVITGGGSGMGLAAAKCMPKEKIIVISGRTVAKLEKAVEELKELGFEYVTLDTSGYRTGSMNEYLHRVGGQI